MQRSTHALTAAGEPRNEADREWRSAAVAFGVMRRCTGNAPPERLVVPSVGWLRLVQPSPSGVHLVQVYPLKDGPVPDGKCALRLAPPLFGCIAVSASQAEIGHQGALQCTKCAPAGVEPSRAVSTRGPCTRE